MKNMFKIMIAISVLTFSSMASAATIDFNLDFAGINGGTLEAGDVSPNAIGTDISIDVLSISGAVGMAAGEVTEASVTGGALNFNTADGTFVITGGVADLDIADGSVLFSSVLYDWTFTDTGLMKVFAVTSGTGNAGDALLDALGETTEANPFAFGGFSLQSDDGVLSSTDFLATSLSDRTVVPIPAAAWLFGTGLLGMVGVARRKA